MLWSFKPLQSSFKCSFRKSDVMTLGFEKNGHKKVAVFLYLNQFDHYSIESHTVL